MLYFGILLAAFAVLLLVCALLTHKKANDIRKNGVACDGRVLEVVRRVVGRAVMLSYKVEYQAQGRTRVYEVSAAPLHSEKVSEGDILPLVYSPSAPDRPVRAGLNFEKNEKVLLAGGLAAAAIAALLLLRAG